MDWPIIDETAMMYFTFPAGKRTRRWRTLGGWFVTVRPVRRTETWVTRRAEKTVSTGCCTLNGECPLSYSCLYSIVIIILIIIIIMSVFYWLKNSDYIVDYTRYDSLANPLKRNFNIKHLILKNLTLMNLWIWKILL